ncbi:hypothetical protein BH09SUM1_BH09SUM1_08340 [soil metagenome]
MAGDKKLFSRILATPHEVTKDDLGRIVALLGGWVKETSNGFIFCIPGEETTTFHRPHPGKYLNGHGVRRAIKLLKLEEKFEKFEREK